LPISVNINTGYLVTFESSVSKKKKKKVISVINVLYTTLRAYFHWKNGCYFY